MKLPEMVKLGDICAKPQYGAIASGSAEGDGPLFVRQTDLRGGGVAWATVPRCDLDRSEIAKYAIQTDDLLVSRLGTVGRSARVRETRGAVFAGYLVRFRVHEDIASPAFVGYALQSPDWWAHVDALRSGAVQPTLNANQMAAFEFRLPPPSEQRAIADVLEAFDDKLAANEQVIRIADELARAQFRAACTDEVPLSSLAQFVNGKAFTKDATGTGRVVIRIAELNSGLGDSTVYNDIEVADDYLARPGDLLFAWSGSLTASRWYRPEAIVNQHIFKVIPNDRVATWLVNQAVHAKLNDFKAIAANKATTMGHIQRHHLDQLVSIPSAVAARRLDGVMAGLWNCALAAEVESLKVAEVRDELLPLLMSGRVRVRYAEKVAEGVV